MISLFLHAIDVIVHKRNLENKQKWSSAHILLTARGFKKIAGKRGGIEYLIINLDLPRGCVKSNVQSIRDIIIPSHNKVVEGI